MQSLMLCIKFYLSSLVLVVAGDDCLPDILHAIPLTQPAGADSLAHSTDSSQETDIMQTSDGGENVVITHDQDPLKARCPKCSFTCNNDGQLELHMKSGHESGPVKPGNFRCPKCSMSTPKKEVLFWHLSHHVGNHSVVYYACSRCNTEKQLASEMHRHIAKRHTDGRLRRCSPVRRVATVHYLQNIMKCPVCKDGLLWKQIFIKHLQDKHELSDLASYLNTNYGDDCPYLLSFPGHLLKSSAENHAESVDEEVGSPETPAISRFHCEKCEFSTSDSDAFRRHSNSHSKTRTESSSEDNTSTVGAALSYDHLNRTKPLRSAMVKANSRIITPLLPKRTLPSPKENRNQSPKRKSRKLRRKQVAHKRISQSEEYSGPYFTRTKNATDTNATAVASKKGVTRRVSANDSTDVFTEFISKLPTSYVFAHDVKCPQCYFTSRVRVNLLRHIKSHVNDEDVSVASGDYLSYDLWQPSSSVPSDKPAEAEPVEPEISEVRDKDDNQASRISLNDTDSGSQERLTTPEADSLSHISDSRGSSGIRDSSADEDDGDELPAQPETLSCETCSQQFDSDVSLERHISRSHGGPYVCPRCGILMWQQNAVRSHYSVVHPDSPLQFETLRRKAADGSREVAGSGPTEKKIARVQGNSACRVTHRTSLFLL